MIFWLKVKNVNRLSVCNMRESRNPIGWKCLRRGRRMTTIFPFYHLFVRSLEILRVRKLFTNVRETAVALAYSKTHQSAMVHGLFCWQCGFYIFLINFTKFFSSFLLLNNAPDHFLLLIVRKLVDAENRRIVELLKEMFCPKIPWKLSIKSNYEKSIEN